MLQTFSVERVATAAEAEPAGPLAELAAALAVFEQGRWRDADRRFATVLASNPSDWPARFYHSYYERYLTSGADAGRRRDPAGAQGALQSGKRPCNKQLIIE